jgi:pyruvate/2-oxoglutarate/acetoin dehydrogenase E1 component
VTEILVEVGTTVDVGTVLARIATDAKPGEAHASEGAPPTSEAADVVASTDGIGVDILDLRTLAPLDRDAIGRAVARTGRVLVLHEANKTMGVGAEVAAIVAEELFESLDAPVVRIGAADVHLTYNAVEQAAALPSVDGVAGAIRRLARY